MRVTIEDIANSAGVSKTTVSRVLNQRYEFMSEETKERVLRVIKELDYSPNLVAQSLKKGKTRSIGVIVPNLLNPHYSGFVEGLGKLCKQENYSLILCNVGEDPAEERRYIQTLLARQVDGLIVCSVGENTVVYQNLVKKGFPLVLADRSIEGVSTDLVTVDDFKGAYIATTHLISLGHRRISLIIPPIKNLSTRFNRLAGYKKALTEQGVYESSNLIKMVTPGSGEVETVIDELLKENTPPTAIFATNALLGLDVIKSLKLRKKKIPQEIALVVYDEAPWAELLAPPLTTVFQPALKLGITAGKQLIERINTKKVQEPVNIILEPKLLIRESTLGGR